MAISHDDAKTIKRGDTLYHTVRKDAEGAARTCIVEHVMMGANWFEIHATLAVGAKVIVNKDRGQMWAAKPAQAPLERDWRSLALRATAGSRFGCILHAVWRKSMPAGEPEFSYGASVTSDGFLMCNYRDRGGSRHMGAFVGTYYDLKNNVIGLSRHLELTAKQRRELEEEVDAWITTDYRSKEAKNG